MAAAMTPEKITERLRLRKELMDSTKGLPIPTQVSVRDYTILTILDLHIVFIDGFRNGTKYTNNMNPIFFTLFHGAHRKRKSLQQRQLRKTYLRTTILKSASLQRRVMEKPWTICTKLVLCYFALDSQQLHHIHFYVRSM